MQFDLDWWVCAATVSSSVLDFQSGLAREASARRNLRTARSLLPICLNEMHLPIRQSEIAAPYTQQFYPKLIKVRRFSNFSSTRHPTTA